MDKHGVALVLDEIATLLEATGDNKFKARAFRSAARAIEKNGEDLTKLIARGELRSLRGLGPVTAGVIEELVVAGESEYHAQLRQRAPSGIRALLRVPGLGPKKISQLFDQLGIADLDSLEAAARSGEISLLKGFGAATQTRILEGLAFARGVAGRRRYHQGEEAAVRLAGFLEAMPGVERAVVAGELRRGLEIVDRIVIVAVTQDRERVARAVRSTVGLTWQPGDDISVHGRFGDNLGVEVLITDPSHAGLMLLFATGSEAHVSGLRAIASERGTPLDNVDSWPADEPSIYEALGLQFVPPELRETGYELELARSQRVPALVSLADLKGCFHCHTTESDGTASVAEMAEGALALGWRYLGIADHSQNASYAGGLTPSQVRKQHREIDDWNRRRGDELWLFKGIEADILQDGQIDYAESDPDILASFDYVVGSVHSFFRQERGAQTRRMVRAVSDPRLTMLGHATGRLLLTRDGYDVDIDSVIEAASKSGALIEINADPHRLDLSWQHWAAAHAQGVRTAINPDAHSVNGMRNVRYGVLMARKASLTPADVLNAWPVEDVKQYFTERKRNAQAH